MKQKKALQEPAGRPRKYEDAAQRLRAFRAKAAYPGHRYDIYLGKDAHIAVLVMKKRLGLSASSVIDGVLRGTIQLPEMK